MVDQMTSNSKPSNNNTKPEKPSTDGIPPVYVIKPMDSCCFKIAVHDCFGQWAGNSSSFYSEKVST